MRYGTGGEICDPTVLCDFRGKELFQRLADVHVPDRIREDAEFILEEDKENINEDKLAEVTFTNASIILFILGQLDYFPVAILPSPRLTINFKFGNRTLIVGPEELSLLYHEPTEKKTSSFHNGISILEEMFPHSLPTLRLIYSFANEYVSKGTGN